MTRREFLKMGALALPAALAGCTPEQPPTEVHLQNDEDIFETISQSIAGCQVTGVKIAHSAENFKHNEATLTSLITKADVVVAEYGMFESVNQDGEFRPWLFNQLASDSGKTFYSSLEKLVAQQNKAYAVVDPEGIINGAVWTYFDGFLRAFSVMQSTFAFLGKEEYSDKLRTTLKWLTVAILFDASRQFPFGLIWGQNYYNILTKRNVLDQISIDYASYRNIRSGQSLNRLCQYLSQTGRRNVLYVAGAVHPENVLEYAQNPISAETILKELPNRIRDLAEGITEARLYNFDQQIKQWVRDPYIK